MGFVYRHADIQAIHNPGYPGDGGYDIDLLLTFGQTFEKWRLNFKIVGYGTVKVYGDHGVRVGQNGTQFGVGAFYMGGSHQDASNFGVLSTVGGNNSVHYRYNNDVVNTVQGPWLDGSYEVAGTDRIYVLKNGTQLFDGFESEMPSAISSVRLGCLASSTQFTMKDIMVTDLTEGDPTLAPSEPFWINLVRTVYR